MSAFSFCMRLYTGIPSFNGIGSNGTSGNRANSLRVNPTKKGKHWPRSSSWTGCDKSNASAMSTSQNRIA